MALKLRLLSRSKPETLSELKKVEHEKEQILHALRWWGAGAMTNKLKTLAALTRQLTSGVGLHIFLRPIAKGRRTKRLSETPLMEIWGRC